MKRGAGPSRESWRRINDLVELCGSGRLGTSCHSMPIVREGRKKSSLEFRGKFGDTSAARLRQAARMFSLRGFAEKAAKLTQLIWRCNAHPALAAPAGERLSPESSGEQ